MPWSRPAMSMAACVARRVPYRAGTRADKPAGWGRADKLSDRCGIAAAQLARLGVAFAKCSANIFVSVA